MRYLKTYENKILDNILDKIGKSGKDSLSPLEKEYLDKISKDQSTKDVQQEMNKKEYVDEIGPYEAKLVLTNVEDVDNYDEPNYGVHKRWNGILTIGDKEYEGYVGFKNDDYLYGYFENIYEELEGLHHEIDQFCENAFYFLINLGIVENFLFENRIEDIEKKFSDKLDSGILNFFKRNDPTENKAYFYWLCDRWLKYRTKIDIKYSPGELIKMIEKYNKIKQKIKKKEIDKIQTVEELADIVYDSELNMIHNEKSKDFKILYDSKEWVVFIPYIYKISREYGDGSWCTVWSDEHFKRRFGDYGSLIYFMNKLDKSLNFALEQTYKNHYNFWNVEDEKKLENETPKEIKEFIEEYIDNELVDNFEQIMSKVPEAKFTEYKYKEIVTDKFKENGIEWVSKLYGNHVIFSAIDILPTYKKIVKKVVKILELDNEENNIDFRESEELDLEDKFYDAFPGNENYISGEGAELIEKYMDWNVLIDFLIPEMDEEDYFEFLEEIKQQNG